MMKRNLKLDLIISDDDIKNNKKSQSNNQSPKQDYNDQEESKKQSSVADDDGQSDSKNKKSKGAGVQIKRPQLSIQNVESNNQSKEDLSISNYNSAADKQKQQTQEQKKGINKNNLVLDQSVELGSMSCELDSEGLKVMREDYEIGREGMRNISTGQIIVGNLAKEDLDIQEVIGNGASGYVYKALHKPSGRYLAIKSINAFDKGKRHQLINDLRSLSKNSCPFLVEFCGALYEEGAVKVALEYMNMGSLKSIIKLAKKNPDWQQGHALIPEPILSKLVQQILCGLSYLNICKKQMHRDIKPDNILVNTQGVAKLTDFGIATELDETGGLAKTFVGTLTYMSPERMEGENYSAKGDIWSLGIVIVEMITGEFPYPETRDFLEMHNLIANKPSPNVPKNGNFSDELFDFVDKCLLKLPEDRASSIQLLAHPWILKYSQSDAKIAQYFQVLKQYEEL
ncbi:mitogen-activated protein kinase kinase 6-like [Stylonychia lemnae]|uniref:mitogen-activated protein kinase kinase n=1 Tax=Stylonychia lemnae TaxID=5949 RepID=A0A078A8P3_STYLE|nr:mitogen-activated protein kinase kinase 6-like [Stylonychia lemnae]|eukprot:CDW78251.1 mitogen-activated protein kinase kinase 6-like [Stylonychia lemnae]